MVLSYVIEFPLYVWIHFSPYFYRLTVLPPAVLMDDGCLGPALLSLCPSVETCGEAFGFTAYYQNASTPIPQGHPYSSYHHSGSVFRITAPWIMQEAGATTHPSHSQDISLHWKPLGETSHPKSPGQRLRSSCCYACLDALMVLKNSTSMHSSPFKLSTGAKPVSFSTGSYKSTAIGQMLSLCSIFIFWTPHDFPCSTASSVRHFINIYYHIYI